MRHPGTSAAIAASLAWSALCAACSSPDDAEPTASPLNPVPMGAGDAGPVSHPGDWASFGGDLEHSRARGGDQGITSGNVTNLQLSWRVEAPGMSATPTVFDGVVYWADWQGGVYAHDLVRGDVVWTRTLPRGITGSAFVTADRVYFGDRGSVVHALERSTGETVWAVSVDDSPRTHLYSSPMLVDGILVIGVSSDGTQEDRQGTPPEVVRNFRGSIVGLAAEDGHELWRLETTDRSQHGAGVPVWSTAAIDRERKAAFIGTGNGYETPVSPLSDALLALDYETGRLAWHVQYTADDAFITALPDDGPDSDVGAAPNLFTIETPDGPRDVVGVGDKKGIYHLHDRDSGQLVWETLTLEVNFNTKVGGIVAPAAYADGRIYVISNTGYGSSQMWAFDAVAGNELWQSEVFFGVTYAAPAVVGDVVFAGSSAIDIVQTLLNNTGVGDPSELLALDAATGAVLHRAPLIAGRGGGYSISEGRVLVGTGFSFFGEEPTSGGLEVFAVPGVLSGQ